MRYVDSKIWVIADFWTYLSEEIKMDCVGFSALWHSKLMSQVHSIRREVY